MAVLAPAVRLKNTPFRNRQNGIYPVDRTRTIELVVADGTKILKSVKNIFLNGKLSGILTAAPAIPTDTTFDVMLYNSDDILVYTKSGIADASNVFTNVIADEVFLEGEHKVEVSFSTTLSGNTATFDVAFHIVTP